MERSREAYWLRYPATSPVKLRWRALTVRHCFHVLPGESILELGAGSGLWTEHLAARFGARIRSRRPSSTAISPTRPSAGLSRTRASSHSTISASLPAESFDYVVGTAILCHDAYAENLAALYRLLKPGGQLLFFEANYWNPQVFLKNDDPTARPVGRRCALARSACASSS